MLLICLGALQSISAELFEAASIDGAGGVKRFRFITLPLLLVALGPLLIGSFAFNFNNFTLIDLVTQGGPPISGTSQPAGATDILISYTFRLAFTGGQGGRGVDYGFAAALSVFIFLITAGITAINFRLTRQLEQVSESL
jgi:ABC-type sugar transport system permease subunit